MIDKLKFNVDYKTLENDKNTKPEKDDEIVKHEISDFYKNTDKNAFGITN
jgi:hypothetical protein